ncbi:MAG: Inorganic pyrophosphatase, partial [Abditibacteriota bacterium]|nr:Inorganic pyrophosphatase [Abditibacteriota bacterium]
KKNGEENDRLIACPVSLPGAASAWDAVRTLEDVGERVLRELEAFLRDYQTFEGSTIELTGIRDAAYAMETVRGSMAAWKQKTA